MFSLLTTLSVLVSKNRLYLVCLSPFEVDQWSDDRHAAHNYGLLIEQVVTQSQILRMHRDTSHNIERQVLELDGNCQKRKSIPPAETS